MRNTSHIGEISRTQIIAALTLQGKSVLAPLGDFQRYDLVIDEEGKFLRVQCKTGQLKNGVVRARPIITSTVSRDAQRSATVTRSAARRG